MHIYNWYLSITPSILIYTRTRHELCTWRGFLCSPLLPFAPLSILLHLLGTLLAVPGSVQLVPRLLVNWLPHSLTWLIYPPTQNPDPPGFSRPKYILLRTTVRTQPISSPTTLIRPGDCMHRVFTAIKSNFQLKETACNAILSFYLSLF